MNQHAYMVYLPTVEFGPGMTSATEIRSAWPTLNPKRKTALVMSLYPKTQSNPKLAATVVKMLDTAMGTEITEVLDTKASAATSQWNTSDPDMVKFNFTASNGVRYQLDFLAPYIGPDEMGPEDFFDSEEVFDNSKFVSFEQLTNDIKGGFPVAKQGIEGTGSAAEVFGIVVNAIIQYVKKARPALLYFQAAEPNRRALYARMIQRVLPSLPGWASMSLAGGQFGIYNKRAVKTAMGAEGVAEAKKELPQWKKDWYAQQKPNSWPKHPQPYHNPEWIDELPPEDRKKLANQEVDEAGQKFVDPELYRTQQYAKQHYPGMADPESAFDKWVSRSLMHSDKDDHDQDKRLQQLAKEITAMKTKIQDLQQNADYLDESR